MIKSNHPVAVVTGGASGIGKALVSALIQRGTAVAIADVDLQQASALADSLGGLARAYRCDVTERSQLDALAQDVLKDFGKINLVFANAGVAIAGSLLSTATTEFDWLLDVNVRGVFNTIQIFAPLLVQSAEQGEPAHFVITGSENSLGIPNTGASSAYTMTKHASLALADTLRRDLAETAVKVSIFCPGVVDTKLYDARRTRQDRYGGRSDMPKEFVERASAAMAQGQSPDVTAELCLIGVVNDEFLIITDPAIRDFYAKRSSEIERALDIADTRLTQERSQK